MNGTMQKSDLYKIEVLSPNPFDLLKEWKEKAARNSVPLTDMFNFATSDGHGRVSARSLFLRQLDEDGFVFTTNIKSKKSFDLSHCSHAAMTFVWVIPSTMELLQVRIEGQVKTEDFNKYLHLYQTEPLFCKIRSAICRQGEHVEWNDLKSKHDQIYEEVQNGKLDLKNPPSYYGVCKMYPEMMDFYAGKGTQIADRVIFRLKNDLFIPTQALNGEENQDKKENQEYESAFFFNNARHIQVGVNDATQKIDEQKWIYYHVAA